MSQELERVYTINLGKVKLSQSQHRAVRAINMIKEFARHHMKVTEIKIEEELSHQVWANGIRRPPRKIRVRMTKTDEGFVLISLYEEETETKEPEKTKPKLEKKPEKEPKPEVKTKQVSKIVEEVKPKEKPKKTTAKEKPRIPSFVDPKKDPQHYINRYNKEKKYKEWFDKNYHKLTIEEAVGLKPSKAKEEKSKEKPKKEPKKTQAKEEKPKKKSS